MDIQPPEEPTDNLVFTEMTNEKCQMIYDQ